MLYLVSQIRFRVLSVDESLEWFDGPLEGSRVLCGDEDEGTATRLLYDVLYDVRQAGGFMRADIKTV